KGQSKMQSRISIAVLSSAFWILGAGCGHHNNSAAATPANAMIRLANGTAASSLTMNGVGVTDTTVTFSSSATASGTVSDYLSVKPQSYTTGIGDVSSVLTASTQSLGLSTGTNYTLLAYARGGAINSFTLVDNQIAPATGFADVVVANAAGDAGSLDVFLVSANASLNGVAPVFTNIAARSTSSGKVISAGTYDIVVTATGRPADVRLSIHGVTLASGDIVTVALTSTLGGGLVDGALVKQGSTMQFNPSTSARVRIVGAFPPNGASNSTVTVTIGNTALGALTAPSVGSYALVNGGTSSYSVSVDGNPVAALPTATFANGGDYTILIAGTPAAPVVTVLADNNQPSNSGAANIRLVNAAVAGTITLNDNFVPIDVDVPYGQTSAYNPATPLSTSVLQVTSPVAAFTTYTANNVNIASGGVYTIFVLGNANSAVVSLTKDR
ncbi:MAG TPA: DUF4397 domain-containing protein, partial [Steroidobacteraceae bacterium]|nr:DUF4397 domain-containing protein [Steroidobacteraceae bacterium]